MKLDSYNLINMSKIGPKGLYKVTANKIKSLLRTNTNLNYEFDFEIYLQGSYKNSTNTQHSDIDVIVQLHKIKDRNLQNKYIKREERWSYFKSKVENELIYIFGRENIISGNKAIKIDDKIFHCTIDILPCLEVYHYNYLNDNVYESINFWTKNDFRQIKHFPKLHFKNGIIKQKDTNNLYKPTIRLFKNIRLLLIENNLIDREDISSYFIECLLSNIPSSLFSKNIEQNLISITKYLTKAKLETFLHQHKISKLIGESPEQLQMHNAKLFIQHLEELILNDSNISS